MTPKMAHDNQDGHANKTRNPLKGRIIAFLALMRIWFVLPPALSGVASAVLASNGIPNVQILIPVLVCAFFAVSGTAVMNDFFDRDSDQANFPHRPIPSGKVSPKEALILGIFLTICSVVSAAVAILLLGELVNWEPFFILLILVISSLLNFGVIKRKVNVPGLTTTITNFSMALGALAAWSAFAKVNVVAIFFFLIIGIWDMGHDNLSAIRDYEGDLRSGVSTFATALGKGASARISLSMFILSFVLALILTFFTNLGYSYFLLLLLFGLLSIYRYFPVLRSPSKENVKRAFIMLSIYDIVLYLSIIVDMLFHWTFDNVN